MQNATISGVVQSVERHRKTVHVVVLSNEYGNIFLVLTKGQCSAKLLKEGKTVSVKGVKRSKDSNLNGFTARKILDPSTVEKNKLAVEKNRISNKGFFYIPHFKLNPGNLEFAQ